MSKTLGVMGMKNRKNPEKRSKKTGVPRRGSGGEAHVCVTTGSLEVVQGSGRCKVSCKPVKMVGEFYLKRPNGNLHQF
jgi:hypothetical protein